MKSAAQEQARRVEKPLVYNTRPVGCQETGRAPRAARRFPQPTDFKPVLSRLYLTLSKTETYTVLVIDRRVFAAVALLFAFALIGPARPLAQAIARSMYVSALNEAGVPAPDLGPSDFVVREDNVAREVLRVAPADAPMQVAVLVDNSEAARDAVLADDEIGRAEIRHRSAGCVERAHVHRPGNGLREGACRPDQREREEQNHGGEPASFGHHDSIGLGF